MKKLYLYFQRTTEILEKKSYLTAKKRLSIMRMVCGTI